MTVCSTVVGLDPLASLVGPGVRRAMIAANRVVGRSWVVAAAAGDGLGRQVDLASVRLDNLMRYSMYCRQLFTGSPSRLWKMARPRLLEHAAHRLPHS
jgi:hypothetical protein